MTPAQNIAIRAARSAGDHILRYLDRLDTLTVTEKSRNDFVSQVDQECERIIVDTIRRAYPDHAVLAEESGASGESEYVWIIDPLDGTTNFLHGFSHFAVSIALEVKGRLEEGIIFDPVRQEIFAATRGSGARVNDRRIRVTNRTSMKGALLGTGFPFHQTSNKEQYLRGLAAMMEDTAGIRRAGAAALDLAYVAAARLDGFWEYGLSKWDLAAGVLLVREAGGIVSDLQGGESYMTSGDIVCSNSKIIRQMLTALR